MVQRDLHVPFWTKQSPRHSGTLLLGWSWQMLKATPLTDAWRMGTGF